MKSAKTDFDVSKYLFAFILFLSTSTLAQDLDGQKAFCGSDEILEKTLERTPELRKNRAEQDQSIYDLRQSIIEHSTPDEAEDARSSATANFTIPVVIYIVHDNGPENISDQQVFSQLDKLNDEFADHGIAFCLATTEGSNPLAGAAPYPGIIRIEDYDLTHHDMNTEETLLKATSPLSSDRYLRIWVVKDINNNSGLLGYAQSLATSQSLDGIVIRYDAFGDSYSCGCSNLIPNYDQGKILAHEVGHYLHLSHTFQGGCAGNTLATCLSDGDKVCDTPQVSANSYGCPAFGSVISCDGVTPAVTDNHMEYTDDNCRTTFTTGQEDRMIDALNLFGVTLVSSANLIYTGVFCSGSVFAVFSADNYSPCISDLVTFTANPVADNPSVPTYTWDFGDGSPLMTGNPISYAYTSPGVYNATLTIDDGTNVVSESKSVYVAACGPINSTQGNWYFYNTAGLDFSSGIPVADDAAYNNTTIVASSAGSEACAVQNDLSGNLLFYTDAVNVWDENHALINSSSPLFGNQTYAEGTIILPDPASNDRYYIFTTATGNPSYNNSSQGLRYSIVQVTGTAASMTSSINVPVLAPTGFDAGNDGAIFVQEGITAIASCDGYWVICTGRDGGIFFNAGIVKLAVYKVTSAGIAYHSEFVTSINSSSVNYYFSVLEASPDGSKIAKGQFAGTAYYETHLYDFDNTTGIITAETLLNSKRAYGLSFSPNSQFLYTADPTYGAGGLYQYNTAVPNPAASEVLVSGTPLWALQAGPNGKIYGLQSQSLSTPLHLTVIHQPDVPSSISNPNACLFGLLGPAFNTFNSGSAITGGFGLPNMLDAHDAAVFSNTISYTVTNCLNYEFSADLCADSHSWDFGDPASGTVNNTSTLDQPTHLFSGPGIYTVTLNVGGTLITETIEIGFSLVLNGPTTACPPDSAILNYSVSGAHVGATYSWSTSSGGSIVGFSANSNVDISWTTLPGTVTLVVTDPGTGCTETVTQTVTEYCEPSCEGTIKTVTCGAVDVNGYQTYLLDIGITNPFTNPANATFTTSNGTLSGTPLTLASGYNSFTVAFTELVSSSNLCIQVLLDEGDLQCSVDICIALPDCDLTPCTFEAEIEYTYSNESPCEILFSPYVSLPSGLYVVSWFWDFGDGNTSNLQNPSHYYSNGSYTVSLTVTATNGTDTCTVTSDMMIQMKGCDPVPCSIKPGFVWDWLDPCTLHFTSTSVTPTGVNITGWQWTVDGVVVSNLQDFTYSFPSSGSYTLCLTVYAENGEVSCYEAICEDITLKGCKPGKCQVQANFSFAQTSSCKYQFTDLSTAAMGYNVTGWQWKVDGVVISTAQNMSYTFPVNGSYEVCLRAVASNASVACKDEVCFVLLVEECLPIEKKQIQEKLSVWPNPSHREHHLGVSPENLRSASIKLYDIAGTEVPFTIQEDNGQASVIITTNNSGMYFLVVQTGNRLLNATLVKY